MRSARNYASLAAEALGARLTDLTVSGATTETILTLPQVVAKPQGIAPGVSFEPQISSLPADADLVTVTAGGNDLQFSGAMLAEAWRAADPASPMVEILAQSFPGGLPKRIPAPTPERVKAMAQGLAEIVRAARAAAAGARVVLVDYLTVIGPETIGAPAASWPLSEAQTAEFARIQEAVRQGFTLAAEDSGAELLRASDLSRDHALGSPEPWVFGFEANAARTMRSFHPNEAGMQAVADALVRLVSSPGQPS